jgi:hypothetical protein
MHRWRERTPGARPLLEATSGKRICDAHSTDLVALCALYTR